MVCNSISTYLSEGQVVRINTDKPIKKAFICNMLNYHRFEGGEKDYKYYGGLVKQNPYDISVPKMDNEKEKWYIVIESDEEIGNIRDYIKIIK